MRARVPDRRSLLEWDVQLSERADALRGERHEPRHLRRSANQQPVLRQLQQRLHGGKRLRGRPLPAGELPELSHRPDAVPGQPVPRPAQRHRQLRWLRARLLGGAVVCGSRVLQQRLHGRLCHLQHGHLRGGWRRSAGQSELQSLRLQRQQPELSDQLQRQRRLYVRLCLRHAEHLRGAAGKRRQLHERHAVCRRLLLHRPMCGPGVCGDQRHPLQEQPGLRQHLLRKHGSRRWAVLGRFKLCLLRRPLRPGLRHLFDGCLPARRRGPCLHAAVGHGLRGWLDRLPDHLHRQQRLCQRFHLQQRRVRRPAGQRQHVYEQPAVQERLLREYGGGRRAVSGRWKLCLLRRPLRPGLRNLYERNRRRLQLGGLADGLCAAVGLDVRGWLDRLPGRLRRRRRLCQRLLLRDGRAERPLRAAARQRRVLHRQPAVPERQLPLRHLPAGGDNLYGAGAVLHNELRVLPGTTDVLRGSQWLWLHREHLLPVGW